MKCEKCGKEVVLPFTCNYCGRNFCDEHRLPERHECSRLPEDSEYWYRQKRLVNVDKKIGACPDCGSQLSEMTTYDAGTMTFQCRECGHKYTQSKTYPHSYTEPRGKRESDEEPRTRRHFPVGKLIGAGLVIVVIGAVLWFSPLLSLLKNNPFSPKNYSHEELVSYALSLINTDRKSEGLQNVTISSVGSGQQHAGDMLQNDYFSHWGIDGSKPYMRYTLAGGRGAVAENIAAFTQGAPSDRKVALKDLENDMMNNDASWNWGHRDNILNPVHNEVSIGISFDNDRLYFVQDLIDDYINWSTFTVTQNQVSLVGSLIKQMTLSQVNIFYDSLPSSLTSYQLANSPYNGAYAQGTFVGMALPPNYKSQQGVTITAQTWVQSGMAFQIKFDISQALNVYGKGVYTIYLQTSSQDSLTTYSIWYD